MLFYASKNNDQLNSRPFQPEKHTGRVMLNPHYRVRSLLAGTKKIRDSGAFQERDMLERLEPCQALERQLRTGVQTMHWTGDYDNPDEAIVTYDMLVGVDEAIVDGKRVKQRGNEETARTAVEETLRSAHYYASQAHRLDERTAIAFAAQGATPAQYEACVRELLPLMRPKDWLAFGGFCIIGMQPKLIPVFYETLERVLPLLRRAGIERAHILGVTIPEPIRVAAAMGKTHGVVLSTDSSSPERNGAAFGRSFVDGAFKQAYTKDQKVTGGKDVIIPDGCYHPCNLALANIERYHQWSQSLGIDALGVGAGRV